MEQAAANVVTDALRTYARKRARTSAKSSKPRRRFRGVVSNVPSVWYFTRMVSTGQSGVAIQVKSNGVGSTVFNVGTTESQSLTMDFALDTFRVYLGGINVSSTAVPGYTELTSLFDTYKLDRIEVFYTCSQTGSQSVGTAAQFYLPGCAYVVDTDDANSTSCAELQQYAQCKYTQFGGDTPSGLMKLADFKPSLQQAVYTTGTTVAGQAPAHIWLDAANADVRHYGFKMALDTLVNSSSVNQIYYMLNFQIRYHMKFKGLR